MRTLGAGARLGLGAAVALAAQVAAIDSVIAQTPNLPFAEAASPEIFRLRPTAFGTALAPSGLLILDADLDASPWIDGEALAWSGRGDFGNEVDVLIAAIRLRDPNRRGEARLGRIFVSPGALPPLHIDGFSGRVRAPWGTELELFGGVGVEGRYELTDRGWAVGARLAQALFGVGKVGVGYLRQREQSALADEEVAVDLFFGELARFDVAARGSFDLINPGPSELVLVAGFDTESTRYELLGSHRSAERRISAISLFSVLGDMPSDHAAARVHWRAAPRLWLIGDAGVRRLGGDVAPAVAVEARLSLDREGRGSVFVDLRRDGVAGTEWWGARTGARVPVLETVALATELEIVFPEDSRPGSPWPFALLGLSWFPTPAWDVALGGQVHGSRDQEVAFDALLRISWMWGA